MGAAGRDFHNFNIVYRDDPETRVVAFTAAQIPGISDRVYPPSLSGVLYPDGVPIVDESKLESLIARESIDNVVFAYSDLPHVEVMHRASRVLAAGADFTLLGPHVTQIRADVPVIAVSAVRTGVGKSQTARYLAKRLRARGVRLAVLRHPMPYGDLASEAVQRFASAADLASARCTVEEREEYEPHIAEGSIVFAGVDYAEIVRSAEKEADIILWDGGNNDFPFLVPDLHIVLTDSLRPGHETMYHPGEACLRMADIVVIAKTDVASPKDVQAVVATVLATNATTTIVRAASPVRLDKPELVSGKTVAVVEDGPTITHGGMATGAGFVAARQGNAKAILDPRPYVVRSIAATLLDYPHIGPVLPAMGYGEAQLSDLEATLAAMPVDAVVLATPARIERLIAINQPVVRATYEYADAGTPTLGELVDRFLDHQMEKIR